VAVQQWPEPTSIFVLRELVWRWTTALQPLPDDWVFNVIDLQMARFAAWRNGFRGSSVVLQGRTRVLETPIGEIDAAYEMLVRECVRHAREIGDDLRFGKFVDQLRAISSASGLAKDHEPYLRYQELLHSLGKLQHAVARQELEAWDTSRADIIWTIRRAGLCMETGLIPLGTRLLKSTLASLRSVPVSPLLDYRRLSAEGITLYLLWCAHAAHKWAVTVAPETEKLPPGERDAAVPVYDALPIESPVRESGRSGDSVPERSNTPEGDTPSRKVIVARLNELRQYGCDPNQFVDWLEEATAREPQRTKGTFREEGFDIGVARRTTSFGSEPQLKSAYQAIRLIEDAGLPLQVSNVISLTVSAKLFCAAVRTIARFTPSEAAGTVLRSRDAQTIELILSREALSRLSNSQVDSLLDAVNQAIEDSIAHLRPLPTPREPEDQFWDEQLRAACAALGRLVVLCGDDKRLAILLRMIAFPHNEGVLGRWQAEESVATCVRRATDSLSKDAILQVLPSLLATPVPGSVAFPVGGDALRKWYDPVRVAADFVWQPRAPVGTASSQIEATIARIAIATGDERVNLCRRVVNLLVANLLSAIEKTSFASSLFANRDQYGFPAETGCFDSLILLLPRSLDEVRAFREKHLKAATKNPSWAELRRTVTPLRQFRTNPARSVKWTVADLTSILDIAESWLEGQTQHSARPISHRDSVSQMLDDGSAERMRLQLDDWLHAIENCIFLNRNARKGQQHRANDLVQRAQQRGWCTTQTAATRVVLGLLSSQIAVAEIQQRLGDRNPSEVLQACNAIVRWHELAVDHVEPVPPALLEILSTLVTARRHESLSLLISTSKDVLERQDPMLRRSFFERIAPALHMLIYETDYITPVDSSPFSMGEKLRIRVACARLTHRLLELGMSSPVFDDWTAAIRSDAFADVRRELDR
jgi:hypothetical protein